MTRNGGAGWLVRLAMRRLALSTLLLLAACGAQPPAPAPSPTAAAIGGAAAKVAALSPRLRAGVLLRAIRDAEQDCQNVIDQARIGHAGAPPVWVATCDDHRRWLVTIAADGTATVTDATAVARGH